MIINTEVSREAEIPRTRQEILDDRRMQLRARFGVKEKIEEPIVEDLNREFFVSLAQPAKTPSPAEIAGEKIHIPQNVLVVAPHPDDEILCCATALSDHVLAGDHVSVLVITDGDGKDDVTPKESIAYGKKRRLETLAAMQKLGVPYEQVMFLGFPDGGLTEIETKNRTQSKFTRLMKTLQTSLFPGTPYTWGGLQSSLREVIKETEADVIYIPGELDNHPDHKVTGRAVKNAVGKLEISPEMKEYMVHFKASCAVTEKADKEKLALIRLFRSQRHDLEHVKFLEDFAYRKEIFW